MNRVGAAYCIAFLIAMVGKPPTVGKKELRKEMMRVMPERKT